MKNRYAVLTMNGDIDDTKERLEQNELSVLSIEETTPAYALFCFGIAPTPDVIKKLPATSTIFVEGTERSFQRYCKDPVNDIGSNWSI